MTDTVIASDRDQVPTAAQKGGFIYHWGPQAWIDMWMSKSMLVDKAMPLVSHSLVPILRLSGDKDEIDRGYRDIRSRRERLKWSDSPREKWRKRYGNLVREIEWALLQLRKYYSQAQYEEIVISTCVSTSEESSADFIAMMKSMCSGKTGLC